MSDKKRPHICKHDQLGRQCNICDLEEEVESLQHQLDAAKQENERLKGDVSHARGCAEEAWRKEDEYEDALIDSQQRLSQAIEGFEDIARGRRYGIECAAVAERYLSLLREESISPLLDK